MLNNKTKKVYSIIFLKILMLLSAVSIPVISYWVLVTTKNTLLAYISSLIMFMFFVFSICKHNNYRGEIGDKQSNE